MSRARIASIVTLSGLLLAAGATYWYTGPGEPSARTSSADEVARLRSQVGLLQRQVSALQNGSKESVSVAKPGEPGQSAKPPTPEEEAAWLNARARSYDAHLEKQARDEKWASKLEAKAVAATKKQKDLGVKLVEARCWSSACRLQFSYTSGKARSQHVYTLGQQFPELPVISYSYPGEPKEHTRAIAYLAKESLPESTGK